MSLGDAARECSWRWPLLYTWGEDCDWGCKPPKPMYTGELVGEMEDREAVLAAESSEGADEVEVPDELSESWDMFSESSLYRPPPGARLDSCGAPRRSDVPVGLPLPDDADEEFEDIDLLPAWWPGAQMLVAFPRPLPMLSTESPRRWPPCP
jgi:hypothetical protein